MPRSADHAARRRQITDAVRRIIAQRGLSAVTFASTSAEAEVSVRLVQYYFGDKATLLKSVLQSVIVDTAARFPADLRDHPASTAAPEGLFDLMTALLPMTHERRADAVVLAAFHVSALTTDDVTTSDTTGPVRSLRGLFAEHLAAMPGEHRSTEEIHVASDLLILGVIGLTQSMLAGYIDAASAETYVRAMIDRLTGT